jgi:hypothetical protein
LDCDHDSGSGVGLATGEGVFLAVYGWGAPGQVLRTRDGLSFESVLPTNGFAGMAFGGGRFVVGTRFPQFSDSLGTSGSWEAGRFAPPPGFPGNARRIFHFVLPSGQGGQVFLQTYETGSNRAFLYSRDGENWAQASAPSSCGQWIRGIAYGAGRLVALGTNPAATSDADRGLSCISTDGGVSWVAQAFSTAAPESQLVYAGDEFVFFNASRQRVRSADGVSWSIDTRAVSPSVVPGAMGYHDGTLVAFAGGWMNWYERQRMFRSRDGGRSWEVTSPASPAAAHPINHLAHGYFLSASVCAR